MLAKYEQPTTAPISITLTRMVTALLVSGLDDEARSVEGAMVTGQGAQTMNKWNTPVPRKKNFVHNVRKSMTANIEHQTNHHARRQMTNEHNSTSLGRGHH
jgi:hypothetical protein